MADLTRALVTGANGFLGSHVVRRLLAEGTTVRAFVQPSTSLAPLAGLPAECVAGDLTDPASLRRACAGQDLVVHLAARLGDYGPAAPYFAINADGTARLIAAARGAGVRRFVLVSSLTVHRFRPLLAGDETLPRDAVRYPYALSKVRAEEHVERAHAAGHIEGVIVRPAMVPYGPGDRLALPPLARMLRLGLLPLVDGGRALTCTIYAPEFARGLACAARLPTAAGRTYNLVDPNPVSWHDWFAGLAAALGAAPPRLRLPAVALRPLAEALERLFRFAHIRNAPPLTPYRVALLRHDFVFHGERAARELGFSPQVERPAGLAATAAWLAAADSAR